LYKAGKAGEGVDWEMARSKYEDVSKMILERHPDNDLNSDACCYHSSPHIFNLLLFVCFVLNLTKSNKPRKNKTNCFIFA